MNHSLFRAFVGLSLGACLVSCSLLGTASGSGTTDDTTATTELTESVGDSEGGVTSLVEDSVVALAGLGAKSLDGRGFSWTSGTSTPVIAWFDASGNPVSLANASSAVSATLTWTRQASYSSSRATGSASSVSSLSFSGLGSDTWTLTGNVAVSRESSFAKTGATSASTLTHVLNLSLNPPSSASAYRIAGGTIETTGSFQVNGGSPASLDYTWKFNGDGTADLSTKSGTVVEVSVSVETP